MPDLISLLPDDATHLEVLIGAARAAGAEDLEVRCDHLSADPALFRRIRGQIPGFLLAASRTPGRGQVLDCAREAGFDAIDVAIEDLPAHQPPAPDPHLVASYHNDTETPTDVDLESLRIQMAHHGLPKLAVTPTGPADLARLLSLAARWRSRGLRFAMTTMGPYGAPGRIALAALGSELNYIPLSIDQNTAPGQIGLPDWQIVRRALDLSGSTRDAEPGAKLALLIGDPVAPSLSPRLFAALSRHADLPLRYVPYRVTADHLGDFLASLRGSSLVGLNVTMPHQAAVIPHLDQVDPVASELQAVNTIRIDGDLLIGSNTDLGAITAVLSALPAEARAEGLLVLGTGGYARTAAKAASDLGIPLLVSARKADEANVLAQAHGGTTLPWGEWEVTGGGIVLDCTPLGMPGQGDRPDPRGLITGVAVVIDTSYGPNETTLITRAREAGRITRDGRDLLAEVAVLSFATFTGQHVASQLLLAEVRRWS